MKLINKINYNFISLAVLILFVGGVVFYIMLRKLILDQIDSSLLADKKEIVYNFDDFIKNPSNYVLGRQLIKVKNKEGVVNSNVFLSDTLLQSKSSEMFLPFRKLEFERNWGDKRYNIKLFTELEFTDNLTLRIMLLLGFLAMFFMLSFFIVFRFVAQASLFDFFDTVDKVKGFKIEEKRSIELMESDIDEFEMLNGVLRFMITKIQNDYKSLKEFTENISHEVQTPLAIIQNKVEQLIQDDNLTDNQVKGYSDILQSISRLSRLNKGLSQLVRIEGGQYISIDSVDITNVISNNINQLEDLIEAKEVTVNTDFGSCENMAINSNLAELLIFNLLKNAIKHNVEGGAIDIKTGNRELVISNTGSVDKLDIQNILKRFVKGRNSNSLGLGLAIVNKICIINNIDIDYSFEEGKHSFKLSFK